MENNLPKGWISISPLAIAEKIRGVSYGKEDVFNENGNGRIPVLRANGIEDNKIKYDDIVYVSSDNVNSNQILKTGDVLIAMSSGSKNLVGKTAQFFGDNKVSFGAFCGVLRPNQNINPKYFGYYFQSKDYRNTISEVAAGTNINNLKNEHFESLRIPIPPLPEQQRIVAKLDELMEKIERSRARLERIPQILKRFRQSVLSAAVSGKLTEKWRERNGSLKVIDNVVNFSIKNSDPIFNENSWLVSRVSSVYDSFGGGTPSRSEKRYWNGGISWVSSGDVKTDYITSGSESITRAGLENSSAKLCPVDSVIVVVRSGILQHTLPVAIVKSEVAINQDIKCFNSISKDLNNWLFLVLKGKAKEILSQNREGTTVQSVKMETLKDLEIEIPSTEEQTEIFKKVEELLLFADKIESRYNKAKAQLDKLPQSLLAKAFRGELVPQDENDEPASVLLGRIKGEEAGTGVLRGNSTKRSVRALF
ncbi:MAG: restriction endonuclease subunit S [Cyclobacteriaceae bacterium]|nr:restriction endonuclease subunit S [Cyclobacteriaceae bacterium]